MGFFDRMVQDLQKTEPVQREKENITIVAERGTPYQRVMAVWRSWISLADRQEPGGWSHPQDAKDFMRTGEAVETMVNDLPRVQWWAVRKAAGVSPAVWRFPSADYEKELGDAEIALTAKMLRHSDTRRYFTDT